MAGLAADQSNYQDQHEVVLTWDDSGAAPANFYSVRLKATNLETGVQRLVQQDLFFGHHTVTDRFAESNISITYDTYVVTNDGVNPEVETHDRTLTITTVGDDYWLIHPTDSSQTVRLFHVTADTYTEEHEDNVLNLIGRGRKVDTGETWGVNGSLTAQLRDRPTPTARQQKVSLLKARNDKVALTLQTPFGDSWQVFLKDIAFARVGGSATNEFIDATIPYLEVS